MATHVIPDEQLIAYAAGELDAVQSSLVAEHAATCAACARTIAHFREIRALLRADHTETPRLATLVRARNIFSYHIKGNCAETLSRTPLDTHKRGRPLH
jgi:anti-sigma factor RsiW